MSTQHGLHSHGEDTRQVAAVNISVAYHTTLRWRVLHDDIPVLCVVDIPFLYRRHQNRMRAVHINSESVEDSNMHNS